jgi:hypothetical protein
MGDSTQQRRPQPLFLPSVYVATPLRAWLCHKHKLITLSSSYSVAGGAVRHLDNGTVSARSMAVFQRQEPSYRMKSASSSPLIVLVQRTAATQFDNTFRVFGRRKTWKDDEYESGARSVQWARSRDWRSGDTIIELQYIPPVSVLPSGIRGCCINMAKTFTAPIFCYSIPLLLSSLYLFKYLAYLFKALFKI